LAVDLTAGNGHDTLFLWQQVASSGRVLALDLQEAALAKTADRLREVAAPVFFCAARQLPHQRAGVHLIADGHEHVHHYAQGAARVVIANLGYLPGSDRQWRTRPGTTLKAMTEALNFLAPGGRLAATGYPGHPGGAEEVAAVARFMQSLSPQDFEVLSLQVENSRQAPRLWLVQKNTGRPFVACEVPAITYL
jgi:hypothetical protein